MSHPAAVALCTIASFCLAPLAVAQGNAPAIPPEKSTQEQMPRLYGTTPDPAPMPFAAAGCDSVTRHPPAAWGTE